ncbi:hypothetical protein BDP27DRAFT_1370773 [Rhodocollybia butyracea]|uniref:Uncharacterized protein n=1 Tax=Rhodocollybia butyracea TaxID=206335 RepID=A0A9P5U064_9AGAR|nr:hypothetical protein BDP27DRAFT_1370773 [Rhodocollybia butyracea]
MWVMRELPRAATLETILPKRRQGLETRVYHESNIKAKRNKEVFLTFLDVPTGKHKDGSPSLGTRSRSKLDTAIKNILRTKTIDIHYHGSNAIPQEQKNILYFELREGSLPGPVQNEWNIHMEQARSVFSALFMRLDIPLLGVIQADGSSLVTFISGQTGMPTSLETTPFANTQAKSAFTRTISAALG